MQRKELYILLFFTGLSICFLHAQPERQTIGAGQFEGVRISSSSDQVGARAENTLNGIGLLPNLNAASRFLAQATLGADYEDIEATAQRGFTSWLDEQLNMPLDFSLEDYVRSLTQRARDTLIARGEDASGVRPKSQFWRFAWMQYTMTQPDVLRNRVALALSEILVISEIPQLGREPLGLADYYDMLLEHALGNYRDLLMAVTQHPCMGVYLTHLNNPRAIPEDNIFPDENYAREVMQLFSIGLYLLNQDGTRVLDQNGEPIPTYTNVEIEEFAKVFTGYTWGDAEEFGKRALNDDSYTLPMKMEDEWHEPGEKYLLNGFVVPDRNPVDGMADIKDAIDNLFYHQNVGPFLAYRLIQRMVKSNPSPEYVGRVAAAFNDNGQGIRGDMKAMVKAILLDPEARDCSLVSDPLAGMLREPLVRYTQLCRAFNAASASGEYRNKMDKLYEAVSQRPLASPSVFNFFQPEYQPIGPIAEAGLVAPEFQITNSQTTVGYADELHRWTMKESGIMQWGSVYKDEPWSGVDGSGKVRLDLSDEMALGESGQIEDLVERLNLIMLHGQLSDRSRQIIVNTVKQFPENRMEDRVRMALFLIMVTPDYLIFR
ncbi:MAG: DUF1800 family protein [Saprospiraceae bacterium]|nr:DUF1800 family protein [Saprospiraceae bacterium]